MADKLVPEYLVAESILDDQQAEMAPPIGCVHVYYNVFVLGDDTHMTHRLEPAPYRTLVYPVLLCQLGYGLLAVNIFRLQTLIVKPFATDELLATTAAFVKLA